MQRATLGLFTSLSLVLAACGGASPAFESAGPVPPSAGVARTETAAAEGERSPSQASDEAPPPPAAAPVAMASSTSRTAEKTSSKAATVAPAGPRVADNGVKAGEWDDNANYRDFLAYIAQQQRLGIDQVDVSHRHFIAVEDKDGHAVPNCKVSVSDGKTSMTLTTAASGRAIVFPSAMGLSLGTLRATTSCLSANAVGAASFDGHGADGVSLIKLSAVRPVEKKPVVDVVFVLDTTGSMSEEIASIKSTLEAVVDHMGPEAVIRVGLVEYKDRNDPFVTKVYPLTSDLKKLSAQIAGIEASGGGDTPEDVNAGLSTAIEKMGWNEQATSRLAFLVADAPPHLDYANSVSYSASAKHAAEKGIKIFTVSASGMDDVGQAVFRQVAQLTGGTNMFVLRGGAGAQSTGAGDAKSSCGGTHENFSSGNLDQLITQKIRLEISSVAFDPMRIAGLGKDEQSKPCADRIVMTVAR